MTIKETGNVGIGTTSPSTLLELSGSGNAILTVNTGNNSGDNSQIAFGDSADADVGFINYDHGTNVMQFRVNGSERMRINSVGQLQIGDTTAADTSEMLKVDGAGASDHCGIGVKTSNNVHDGYIAFHDSDANFRGQVRYDHSVDAMFFNTAATERMRIDSSGRVIVGSSSHIGGAQFVVMGGNINTYGAVAIGNKDDNPIENATFAQVRLNSGATGTRRGAEIRFQPSANWTDGSSHPTKMIVSLVKENNTGSTDRFRIDHHGRIDHFADAQNGYDLHVGFSDNSLAFAIRNSSTSLDDGNIVMRIEGDGDVQNSNNSFGAISDISIKENIVDANSQLNDIKALKVRNFNFKKETGYGSHTQIGLVAQELEIVSPGLVKEDHEGLKEVKYSVLYMKAIKALQETIAKVETLETKVAALEAA
jgi:hypothetical protein